MDITNVTNFVVRDDTIEQYLKEISKFKVLSEREERDLFAKYQDCVEEENLYVEALKAFNSPEMRKKYQQKLDTVRKQQDDIRNEVICSNLRLNFAIAKRYSNGPLLPDLISTGAMAMYDAFKEYDWTKGYRFTTLAQYYIRRAINAYLSKENLLVRPKGNVRIAPKVKKIENEFMAKNGRRPYAVEIVDILRRDYGIDVKDESEVYGVKVDKIESYFGDDDDNTFERSGYFNEHTAVDNEYEEQSDTDGVRYAINKALESLTEREKKIVSMAYGYGYPREYKDKEIAEVVGLTSERVRQIRKSATQKMREAYVEAEKD